MDGCQNSLEQQNKTGDCICDHLSNRWIPQYLFLSSQTSPAIDSLDPQKKHTQKWMIGNVHALHLQNMLHTQCWELHSNAHEWVVFTWLHETFHRYTHTHTCACAHTYIRMHAYTCTRIHRRTHVHVHTCTHVHIHTYVYTHVHTCARTHTHIHTYTYTMYTCTRTRVHTYMCTHTCTHVHTHAHTHTHSV